MKKEIQNNSDLFARVLTGNATTEERQLFDTWIHQSEENKSDFTLFKKAWASAEILREHDLERAKLKTRIKIYEKMKAVRGFMYYWQRVAAVLIIPLVLGSLYFIFRNQPAPVSYSTMVKITTPMGSRTSFQLPDGSSVWLNAGSEISYPEKFGKTREIMLTGEAYLEVKKEGKPFVVQTAFGNVKVLGTKFNVSAYGNETFRTTLIEGSVAIDDKIHSKEVLLSPGYQFVSEQESGRLEKVQTDLYTSWKEGKLVFRREPFELVAKRLERWFNIQIQLNGESIKKLWYTGTIEMESFSEVLDLIKNTTPINYSFDTKNRTLTITAK